MSFFRFLALGVVASSSCMWPQSWSVGAIGGFGFYRDVSLTNASGPARAGFGPRFAIGAVLRQDVSEHFGGEIRYLFRDGDSKLSSRGTEVNMDAAAHVIDYNFVLYATPKSWRFRPYAAGGGGWKFYTATGTEYVSQPLSNFALLKHRNQGEPLASFGGGVKTRIGTHWDVRLDFRDFATPFPDRTIVPAANTKVHGWLHDFVPMVGVDWVFGR